MTGHMRGGVRYPLSEKARERYRYDLARARAGDPVAPAETPAQQAEQAERERAAKAKRERAAKARAKARRAAKAKRERAAKKRAAEKRAAEKRAAEKRAAEKAKQAAKAKQPTERLERKLVKAGLARLREKFPEKYSKGISKKESPALLIKRMKPDWANTCKAEGVSLDDYPLSDSWWDTVARAIGRRKDPRRR